MRTLSLALLALLLIPAAAAAKPKKAPGIRIHVVSNRADLISAGDALVRIKLPQADRLEAIRVTAGGRDVTRVAQARPNGKFEGLVTGLKVGRTMLRARAPHRRAARATIVNHPNGGPVLSGPQVQPWVCQAGATDAQCNAPRDLRVRVQVLGHRRSCTAYDPDNPPLGRRRDDDADGRDASRSSSGPRPATRTATSTRSPSLFQPGKPWEAVGAAAAVQPQAADHPRRELRDRPPVAAAPSVTGDTVTGGSGRRPRSGCGFAVMSTALDNAGHNCNIATQAESLIMAKERLVERYGELRYTIGTGCSGGSLTQQQVANAYPGIYQGILPQCSFPDSWSTGQQLAAYNLIRRYVEDPTKWAPGVLWDPAVDRRRRGPPQPRQLDRLRQRLLDRPRRAGRRLRRRARRPGLRRRDQPGRRPLHARRLHDQRLRPAAESVWSPQEQALGRGFAGLPLDDVGVQFGLAGAREGPDHAGPVRRPQREDRRRRRRHQPHRRSAPRPTTPRCATPTAAAAINTDQQPRPACRSSTCAAPTPARSTTPTARGRSAPGSSASTATSRATT